MLIAEKAFLDATDVMELLGVKRSRAYSIIKSLNDEMTKAGKLTIRGKVNAKYLKKKLNIEDMA